MPVSAKDISQALETSKLKKQEYFQEQGMPSANALMEAGFQIGGRNPDVQSHSTPGVENVDTSGKVKVEASQTITETLENLLVTREWLEQNPQFDTYDIII